MRLYNINDATRFESDDRAAIKEKLSSGLFVPSVSEILHILNPGDHILKWNIENSVSHLISTGDCVGAVAYRDNTANEFGTVCHNLCERHLKGLPFNDFGCDETHVAAVQPFFRWADRNVKETLFCESYFASSELGYGGTADALVLLSDDSKLLLDLKFKKHSKKYPMHPDMEYKYQLSAYRQYFKQEYGPMEIGNILMASPYGYSPKPHLEPYIYKGGDWLRSFNYCKLLWRERWLQ